MKQAVKISSMVMVVMLIAIMYVFPATVQARSVTVVEGAKYDAAGSMKDNLRIYLGKDIVIHLRSGKVFQGHLKSVGDHLIHLEKLSDRDFYDALIRMEDITAIESRFREMK